jgi:vitamin B12 transporter
VILSAEYCNAQKTDTLTEVKLSATKPLNIAASSVPVQVMNKEDLQKTNSLSIADAVKYFSGIVVKDYGGVGGLKTISVRSLGANHTGVMYDGILLGDAQGGQTDLGKYSLDNVESIRLFNSAPQKILQPARAYSAASVLSLKCNSGKDQPPASSAFMLNLKAGSFGLINPSATFRLRNNRNFYSAVNGEYLHSKGDYKFISYEDHNEKISRNNSEINAARLEYDAVFSVSDSNEIKFKTYYYKSERGLPGAVIFFNPVSNQFLNDKDFFTQASWENHFSKKSALLISAKFNAGKTFYTDPSYPNSAGKLENEFHQQEQYLSAAVSHRLFSPFTISAASDFYRSNLKRTDQFAAGFANPTRNTFLNNVAIQFLKDRYDITGNILYTVIKEKVRSGLSSKDLKEFTPAVSASAQIFSKLPLRVRFFYKNIFRTPTFNDLYYTNIGNVNLRPEFAQQFNTGLTYSAAPQNFIKEMIFTADGYINRVTDQILAVPRQNLFQWTMLNIGKTNTKGIDATLQLSSKEISFFNLSAGISYSFQNSEDISDPQSRLYRKQLPYIPKHSGSMRLNVAYKKTTLSFNSVMASYRYRLGEQIPENIVQGFVQQDISFQHDFFRSSNFEYRVIAEANNVFNTQYEIIKFYPMPGINYRIGLKATFKHRSKNNN